MAVFTKRIIEDFIGKGIGWPIELKNGRPKIITGVELILSSIKVITMWPKGTMFFNGEFGSLIYNSLEEPNNDILAEKLKTHFTDTVLLWEPRVEYLNVTVKYPSYTKVEVTVVYRVINNPNEQSYIFPFNRRLN